MPRIADGHRLRQRAPAGRAVGKCAQRLGDQRLAMMCRAVGNHDPDRVAHPVDEVGDHQAGFGEVRVLHGHTDFGWTSLIQGQHRLAGYGPLGGHRCQVGGTDRQAYRRAVSVCHVFLSSRGQPRARGARRPPMYRQASSPARRRGSADGAGAGDQRKVQRGDPPGRQVVDGRDRVERPHPGCQAAGGGGIAS